MKFFQKPLISIASGLLLFAAWPVSPFTFLIFIAFVPLFWIEANTKNTNRFFWLLWLNLFVWNLATTWWIWNASPAGAVGAIVANSLLMCFPWMLFRVTKKKLGDLIGYTSFIFYWLTFEYIHLTWDLSWPWLTLGNVFATSTSWVQWYEYTGTTGGSLWVLIVNILIYWSMVSGQWSELSEAKNRRPILNSYLVTGILIAVIPALLSFLSLRTFGRMDKRRAVIDNIVVVQPNVESYTEKFSTSPAILIDKMIALSESKMDTNTRMVVWPETAIPVQVWEHEIATDGYYQKVFAFAQKHPRIMLVTGIDSYKLWGGENPGGFSIRTLQNGDHYEAFNTAFATDSSRNIQLYHKTKLVPGVESLPSWLGFMGKLFDDLGGMSGTLGRSNSAVVFSSPGNPYVAAPIICYESIYGNYLTEYCRNGANVLTIVTNDGWWGNTPGYKQHMNTARLRAIETRRWIARSANTGISCFIDDKGNVIDPQPWDKAAAIKMNVPANKKITFYIKHGDWMSRLAWPLALILLLWLLITDLRKRIFNN